MKVFLVYGGKSAEHEVSVDSAASFIKGISFENYQVVPVYITQDGEWLKGSLFKERPTMERKEQMKLTQTSNASDGSFEGCPFSFEDLKEEESIVFPLLHGPNGEDGSLQGMMELLDVPYVGPGILPCAVGLDKVISKNIFQQAQIPQTPFIPVLEEEWEADQEVVQKACEEKLRYPLYVKPANMGSSIGISKVESSSQFSDALEKALVYDNKVVVEEGVHAREMNVALLGNSDVKVSIVGELVKEPGFYDYEAKYINHEARQQYPAEIKESQQILMQELSKKGFRALDGNGMARCDLFLTEDGTIYLNEINMIPGFSQASIFAQLWKYSGLDYAGLIDEMIRLGMERHGKNKRFHNQKSGD